MLLAKRVRQTAATQPAAQPGISNIATSRSTSVTMLTLVAPSAMRTPSSLMRRETWNAMIPKMPRHATTNASRPKKPPRVAIMRSLSVD